MNVRSRIWLCAHTAARTWTRSWQAGRNGIRFDLNSANRSIDFTAFKHPLAKRQSLGVVPVPVVRVREGPARSNAAHRIAARVLVLVNGDERRLTCSLSPSRSLLRSLSLAVSVLVADAVLIIMLIEISTPAKIDGASPSGFHARVATPTRITLPSSPSKPDSESPNEIFRGLNARIKVMEGGIRSYLLSARERRAA